MTTPFPARIEAYDRDAPAPSETETATVGLGCFWGPDAQFGALDGVVRTRVGYAGGTVRDPTYHALGDHSEVLQIDYDPEELAFTDVLDIVFRSHDPTQQARNTQYQNVVLAASEAQREAIDSFLDGKGLDADAIATRIEQLSRFYPAEDYHQKYSLRSKRAILEGLEAAGYDDEAIRESPAAAKLNAEAAGKDVTLAGKLGRSPDRFVEQ